MSVSHPSTAAQARGERERGKSPKADEPANRGMFVSVRWPSGGGGGGGGWSEEPSKGDQPETRRGSPGDRGLGGLVDERLGPACGRCADEREGGSVRGSRPGCRGRGGGRDSGMAATHTGSRMATRGGGRGVIDVGVTTGGGRGTANSRIEGRPNTKRKMGARTADARHLSGSKPVPRSQTLRVWRWGLGTANHVAGTEIGSEMVDRVLDECRRGGGAGGRGSDGMEASGLGSEQEGSSATGSRRVSRVQSSRAS